MKRTICLILGLFASRLVFGQEGKHVIGLKASSAISTQGWFNTFQEPSQDFTYAGGAFYDWQFSRNMGLTIAPSQRVIVQRFQDYCLNCFLISFPVTRYSFHYLELPVSITINATSNSAAKWKANLVFGYTFGYLVAANSRNSGSTQHEQIKRWYRRDAHQVNFGIEARHKLGGNYLLAFGPNVGFWVQEAIGQPFLGLQLKFGQIL